MNEKQRIETLLTALDSALGLVDDTMRYTIPMEYADIEALNRINDSLKHLEEYAKHERERLNESK